MKDKIKVLVVDDVAGARGRIRKSLNPDKVDVVAPESIGDALQKVESQWEEWEVIILDMRLVEWNTDMTGPQIVIEVRDRKKEQGKDSFQPEFIVLTDHKNIDYYRFAFDLGVAAYLIKGKKDPLEPFVKVMALRRALGAKNPKIKAEVERIALQSGDISEAIRTFCREVLRAELENYLGAPFVILFTGEDGTYNCAEDGEASPEVNLFYRTLQALAHAMGSPAEPFTLESSKLGQPPSEEVAALLEKFDGAAFFPLSLSNNMRLSIGILRGQEGAEASASPKALCSILAQHLRPTVLENLISVWSQLTEFRVTRNNTAKLCVRVGHEINDGLMTEDPEGLERLGELADDLDVTGQYLTYLANQKWPDQCESVSIREMVEATWESISRPEDHLPKKPNVQGDCEVWAQKRDVQMIVSRLLQWLAYRGEATPVKVEPEVRIECSTSGGSATVIFEDNSERLPKELRDDLFAPFTQAITTPFPTLKGPYPQTGRYLPLYLAKMLVEGRYLGRLEDHSDQIKGQPYGHRILLQLPAANGTD
jgi:CheY-like chemotaxis protein